MAKSKRIVTETPEQETMAEADLPGRSPRQRLSARLGADRVFYGWYMVMVSSASNFFTAGIVIYGIGSSMTRCAASWAGAWRRGRRGPPSAALSRASWLP